MNSSAERIAAQNDQFRQEIGQKSSIPGEVVVTQGIAALGPQQQAGIVKLVKEFDDFTEDNDPYGEHDFGALDVDGVGKIFWKIDYYDLSLEYGSEDPANPEITKRVLTIMFASEY